MERTRNGCRLLSGCFIPRLVNQLLGTPWGKPNLGPPVLTLTVGPFFTGHLPPLTSGPVTARAGWRLRDTSVLRTWASCWRVRRPLFTLLWGLEGGTQKGAACDDLGESFWTGRKQAAEARRNSQQGARLAGHRPVEGQQLVGGDTAWQGGTARPSQGTSVVPRPWLGGAAPPAQTTCSRLPRARDDHLAHSSSHCNSRV